MAAYIRTGGRTGAVWLFVWMGVAVVPAAAQITRSQAQRLAVDVVAASSGREFRGAILKRTDAEVQIAVRREWLQARHPHVLHDVEQRAAAERIRSRAVTLGRVQEWIKAAGHSDSLQQFLIAEQMRLMLPGDVPPPSRFALVTIPIKQVRQLYVQDGQRRQLALVAWKHDLADVESQNVVDLREVVEQQCPGWTDEPINLAHQLPMGLEQSTEEWYARRGIIEHRLTQSPLEFQGTGDVILPTGGTAPQTVQDLIAPLLSGQLGANLGLKGAKPGWQATAVSAAKAKGQQSVRVTRVKHDLPARQVAVESVLLAPDAKGDWQVIWRMELQKPFSAATANAQLQVQNDPQVAEIVNTLKSLGLDQGLGDGLDQALGAGAVTLELQQQINDAWYLFSEQYLDQVDGPPLPISLTAPTSKSAK